MKKYLVPVSLAAMIYVPAMAEDVDDLVNKLQDSNFLKESPLPVLSEVFAGDDLEYMGGEYTVDLYEAFQDEEGEEFFL